MKKSVVSVLCLFALALALPSLAADAVAKKSAGWLDNFEQAKKESAQFKQPIFALFTGSDWCGWCIKLESEALGTQAFKDYASKNLILFKADFPARRKLPAEVRRANKALARQYNVRGFPTVLILDKEGKKLAETGYRSGGGQVYVNHIKELTKTPVAGK